MSKTISWFVLIYWELGFLIYFIGFDITGKILSLILMIAPIVFLYNRRKVITENIKIQVEVTDRDSMNLEYNEDNDFEEIEIEKIQADKFDYFVD